MDAENPQDILQEEERRQAVAHDLMNAVIGDLYKLFKPYASKVKSIASDAPVSRACNTVYAKYKQKNEGNFSIWLLRFIVYLHRDFINEQALYKLWRDNDGRIE
jgi:hypothetical protein